METYADCGESVYAVARRFNNVEALKLVSKNAGHGFFFKVDSLGDLCAVDANDLFCKCVVLPRKRYYLLSVVSEGFEHN